MERRKEVIKSVLKTGRKVLSLLPLSASSCSAGYHQMYTYLGKVAAIVEEICIVETGGLSRHKMRVGK